MKSKAQSQYSRPSLFRYSLMIFTLHLQFTPLAPKEQEGIELKEFACFKAYCCYWQITALDVSDNKTLFAVYYTTNRYTTPTPFP